MKFLHLASLLALWPLAGALAKDVDPPKTISREFDLPLPFLHFFEDSEVALLLTAEDEPGGSGKVYRTTGAGDEWELIEDFADGEPFYVLLHPTDKEVAVTLGRKKKHWITYDKGKTWKSFKTELDPDIGRPIAFHAEDSKRFLFNGNDCPSRAEYCYGKTWYTTNGFESLKLMLEDRKDCLWAKDTDLFAERNKDLEKDTVLCIEKGKFSKGWADQRLMISNDFFETSEQAKMGSRVVNGITNIAAVKGYIVAAARVEHSQEMSLFVTTDAATWHRAEFGEKKLEEDAYTLLESTKYSMQVDVKTSGSSYMGELFSSNSEGTYFTPNIKHTNRNRYSLVDFEKIQDIQGILLVNTVGNVEDVERNFLAAKKLTSQISFDDGRTWTDLKAGSKKKTLHLHSVTDQRQNGRIFSSAAPGLVLGVGNEGKYLEKYEDGDLYVSQDAGATWSKTRDGPHLYEFGAAGSIILATPDSGATDKAWYSFDFGETWDSVKLPDIRVNELTTITDSTSLKFLISGSRKTKSGNVLSLISVDFTGMKSKCKDKDYEDWYARVDSDDKPSCIMGHTQKFRRRKPKADCIVDDEYNEPEPVNEPCECTKADFECDFNFKPTADGKKCEPHGTLVAPPKACKDGEEEFEGSSGWRLIPGNDCKRTDGKQLDDLVKQPCDGTRKHAPVETGVIKNTQKTLGRSIAQYQYLERKSQGEDDANRDESIIALTTDAKPHVTHDHGRTWDRPVGIEKDDKIYVLYRHPYNNDYLYMVRDKDEEKPRVYYSNNWGKSFRHFKAPSGLPPDRKHHASIQMLRFHPKNPSWLMWIGGKDCKGKEGGPNCHTAAYYSTTGGDDWTEMTRWVEKCQFVSREDEDQLILCAQHTEEDFDAPLKLVSSSDFFKHSEVKAEEVVNFATMAEYIVVAAKDGEDKDSLKVETSIDGDVFAGAAFPKNFQVPHQSAYTVLDSSTGAIFLHVTTNSKQDQEYGTIIKSNSNGTYYVLSVSNVNRNTLGYVDFEKIPSIAGVAIVNVVANVDNVMKGEGKQLRTKMTHNDGADWALLPPPEKDSNDKKYGCAGKSLEDCSLHLHGYSEREDPRTTFASPTAVGFVMGVGSVGPYLSAENTETFLSTDAGVTWRAVKAGNYMFEYGDQGSIIAMVQKHKKTNIMYYSTDMGQKWDEHKFSEEETEILAITTVPSDDSLRFLLWGDDFTISVDFSGLFQRQCDIVEGDTGGSEKNDYELFLPQHPELKGEEHCLFGKITAYHRKKAGRDCWNDPSLEKPHAVTQNCTCERRDFECDYNFEKQSDGSCGSVPGTKPRKAIEVCLNNPELVEYTEVTGYRRIPLDTCTGGIEFDIGKVEPCIGHDDEFNKKHGISAAGLFFAILLPVLGSAAIGYFVFEKWGGQFGQIRLGEGPSLYTSRFRRESNWVQWPVAALSGVVAVVAAMPLLIASVVRSIRGYFPGGYSGRTYTSRSSFARGRGDYAAVDADEGELLGEDSDEEA